MAKQRWAAFSVADHLDPAALVPDILSFDRLVFPYPRDEQEWNFWESEGWNPRLLDVCLTDLGDLARPFEWGEPERAKFRTRLAEMMAINQLGVSAAAHNARCEATTGRSRWEIAKQATRITIGDEVKYQFGDDCWVMPRYGSLAALQADKWFVIKPDDRERRRTRLAVLIGHELAVPVSADPLKATNLAIELARDGGFQRARRALYEQQELTVLQEQSGIIDARAFADSVADFNRQVHGRTKDVRTCWIFTVLKSVKDGLEILEKPFSSLLGIGLEIAETASDWSEEIPLGPVAVFHYAKRRVFDPSS